MIVNTVRMIDYDQLKEHVFGNDSSLKENLAIGILNSEDYEKLNLTPSLNLKLVNKHGQVIIKIKQEKNVPLGTILMPISRQALRMRRAISPRLAITTLDSMHLYLFSVISIQLSIF